MLRSPSLTKTNMAGNISDLDLDRLKREGAVLAMEAHAAGAIREIIGQLQELKLSDPRFEHATEAAHMYLHDLHVLHQEWKRMSKEYSAP